MSVGGVSLLRICILGLLWNQTSHVVRVHYQPILPIGVWSKQPMTISTHLAAMVATCFFFFFYAGNVLSRQQRTFVWLFPIWSSRLWAHYVSLFPWVVKVRSPGCLPLTHHLEGDFDTGRTVGIYVASWTLKLREILGVSGDPYDLPNSSGLATTGAKPHTIGASFPAAHWPYKPIHLAALANVPVNIKSLDHSNHLREFAGVCGFLREFCGRLAEICGSFAVNMGALFLHRTTLDRRCMF